MTWPSWLACFCDLWQPTPEKQGILECSPSSGPLLSTPITSQPQLRARPFDYLCALLAPAPPPPYRPGQSHHDASSVRSTRSIIEQGEDRHKERKERQRIEAEARDKSNAARNKITSAYGSRMLKVGLVSQPPTPRRLSEDTTETSPLCMPSYPDSDGAHAPAAPSGRRVDSRSRAHLTYGTFGTFAPPTSVLAPAPEAGYPGVGMGFPAGPPASPRVRVRRPVRPLNGLTVQVPAVPLESVRRHVTEMLFNIRGDETDDSSFSHTTTTSALPRVDSRYSVASQASQRSRTSISPTSGRFPGVVVTPADSDDTSASTSHIALTPTTPKTPKTPATPAAHTFYTLPRRPHLPNFAPNYPHAHNYAPPHPSTEPPLSASKFRRHSDETPRAYRSGRDDTPRPRRPERSRSDTPPRGRQRTRGTPRPRRESISTQTDDTDCGDHRVVYKQIGLSGLPGLPGRKRYVPRKKTRFED